MSPALVRGNMIRAERTFLVASNANALQFASQPPEEPPFCYRTINEERPNLSDAVCATSSPISRIRRIRIERCADVEGNPKRLRLARDGGRLQLALSLTNTSDHHKTVVLGAA